LAAAEGISGQPVDVPLAALACLVNCSGHVVTVGERLGTEFS